MLELALIDVCIQTYTTFILPNAYVLDCNELYRMTDLAGQIYIDSFLTLGQMGE